MDNDSEGSSLYRMSLYQRIAQVTSSIDKIRVIFHKIKLFDFIIGDETVGATARICRYLRNKMEHFDVELTQPKRKDGSRKGFLLGYITYEYHEIERRAEQFFLVSTVFKVLPLSILYDGCTLNAPDFERDHVSGVPVGDIWYHGYGKVLKLSECANLCSQVITAIDSYVEKLRSHVQSNGVGHDLKRIDIAPAIEVKKTYDTPIQLMPAEPQFTPIFNAAEVSFQTVEVNWS